MSWKNRLNWSRFLRALQLFFTSEMRWKATGWTALLLALLMSVNGLNVVNSYVGRNFITALTNKNRDDTVLYAVRYLGVFAGLTGVSVFYRFSEERLRLVWRTWLTGVLIDRYLAHHAYYRIKQNEEIDNPDQRITEDVRSYTQTTLSFFLLSLNATITSLAFLGVLWSITPWLVVVAVAYAALGSTATVVVGRSLAHLNNLQLKKEADLRYQLIQAREAAESIAAMRVEATVGAVLADRLTKVAENNRAIIAVTRNIGFFTVGYNYLIQLLPILIVAPLYLRGDVEFGVVTQAAMAFAQVLGAFSLIVTQFEPISAFAAVAERLNRIGDVIVEARHAPRTTAIRMVEDDGRLGFEGLSLWTPQEHRLLVQDLSVSLQQGSTLLITGPNTAAAGALVMAAAGVWAEGEGRITRPPPDLVHFVPQRPFAAPGTLRAQLLLTNPLRTFTDEQLLAALRAVGLDALVARVGGLDGAMDWAGNLSPGEQHLLAFARVLLASPRFVFLDRVFGALSPDQLEHLYRLLSESSITYISVGDEQGLLAYHHLVLELRDEGGWRITTAMGALVE